MMEEAADKAAIPVGAKEGLEKSEIRVTYLGALTSAPLSMSNLTTISFPPEQAA